MKRPDNGLPEDLRDHARLMADIVAMAFQTDKTRVASLILARDLSALYYPFLDVREAHHGASHNDTSEGYERIARFHLSQFAYLAQRLDEMPEGEGTVLDNCCLLYHVEHVLGLEARQHEGAADHRRRPRRHARNRPHARLRRRRRRQPQAVHRCTSASWTAWA